MDGSATLPCSLPALAEATVFGVEESSLEQSRELERFLASVERRAFRIAELALRDADDALDAVQESMIQLARHYGARPTEEWKPLFYRILNNRIRDFQRRRKVRARLFVWFSPRANDDGDAPDPAESTVDPGGSPSERLEGEEAMKVLGLAIGALPARQQQAFILRNFEGLDVAQTAVAMGCSEGSVKTHYFRAVQALKGQLEEHWS
jgi:RNA polymerase sigma-70 factor (ECF subfamily)